jgi:DNA replication licensing factor MCM3
MHRYLPPGVEDGTPVHDNLSQPLAIDGPGVPSTEVDGGAETTPFEKYDPLLHVGLTATKSRTRRGKQVKTEVLSIAFIKKYIQYAKSKPAPVLTKGAANHIVNVYANLRNEDEGQTNRKKVVFFSHTHPVPYLTDHTQTAPLTARTLETLIRLSTAHAKARLSVKVESEDARAAEEIMRYALYKEVAKRQRQKRKKRKLNRGATLGKDGDGSQDSSDDDDEDDDAEDEQPEATERMSMPPQGPTNVQPANLHGSQDTLWNDGSQDLPMDTIPPANVGSSQEGGVHRDRLAPFSIRALGPPRLSPEA